MKPTFFIAQHIKNSSHYLAICFRSFAKQVPKRLKSFLLHLFQIRFLPHFSLQFLQKPTKTKVMLPFTAWLSKFFFKLFDIVGFAEWLSFFWHFAKPNLRTLTETEIAEAQLVFHDSLPLHKIRIDENSLIAKLGAKNAGSKQMGICVFYTIHFTRKINIKQGNADMAWLIHELVHIAQMENGGSQYIGEALYAQATDGYYYGGGMGLKDKNFSDFNREQQGSIAQDFYYRVLYPKAEYELDCDEISHYENVISDLRQKKL
ncbi:MAG: hypothetical protein ACPG5B_08875 [Chitinophagales bacterium]